MRRALGWMALSGVVLMGNAVASAATVTLAKWSFDPIANDPNWDWTGSVTGSSGPTFQANVGTGSFTGQHASSSTGWSTPFVSGSSRSFSATRWAVGDYFQFSTSTLGYESLSLSFNAMSTSSGPKNFKIAYSLNGLSFTDLTTYSVIDEGWNNSVGVGNPYVFDFSSIIGLNDASSVYFRLIQTDTTSTSGGSVGNSGSSRIDNVIISGSAVPVVAIPLPPAVVMGLGLMGMVKVMRARQ